MYIYSPLKDSENNQTVTQKVHTEGSEPRDRTGRSRSIIKMRFFRSPDTTGLLHCRSLAEDTAKLWYKVLFKPCLAITLWQWYHQDLKRRDALQSINSHTRNNVHRVKCFMVHYVLPNICCCIPGNSYRSRCVCRPIEPVWKDTACLEVYQWVRGYSSRYWGWRGGEWDTAWKCGGRLLPLTYHYNMTDLTPRGNFVSLWMFFTSVRLTIPVLFTYTKLTIPGLFIYQRTTNTL